MKRDTRLSSCKLSAIYKLSSLKTGFAGLEKCITLRYHMVKTFIPCIQIIQSTFCFPSNYERCLLKKCVLLYYRTFKLILLSLSITHPTTSQSFTTLDLISYSRAFTFSHTATTSPMFRKQSYSCQCHPALQQVKFSVTSS